MQWSQDDGIEATVMHVVDLTTSPLVTVAVHQDESTGSLEDHGLRWRRQPRHVTEPTIENNRGPGFDSGPDAMVHKFLTVCFVPHDK